MKTSTQRWVIFTLSLCVVIAISGMVAIYIQESQADTRAVAAMVDDRGILRPDISQEELDALGEDVPQEYYLQKEVQDAYRDWLGVDAFKAPDLAGKTLTLRTGVDPHQLEWIHQQGQKVGGEFADQEDALYTLVSAQNQALESVEDGLAYLAQADHLPAESIVKTVNELSQTMDHWHLDRLALDTWIDQFVASYTGPVDPFRESPEVYVPLAAKLWVGIDHPQVALTFDDGPSDQTEALMEVLDRHKAKATFFMTGIGMEASPESVEALQAAGHWLGTHSYDHAEFDYLSDADVMVEVLDADQILQGITGESLGWFRTPYGQASDRAQALVGPDYTSILWTVDSLDWQSQSAPAIEETVLTAVDDASVVLMHDKGQYTVEALDRMLTVLDSVGAEYVSPLDIFGGSAYTEGTD